MIWEEVVDSDVDKKYGGIKVSGRADAGGVGGRGFELLRCSAFCGGIFCCCCCS
jgi:hypothetical protein